MKRVSRDILNYAVLLLVLLSIAALAAWHIINEITEFVGNTRGGAGLSEEGLARLVTIPILALTGGFFFLSGALGILMMRHVAIAEARRRVGRFVEAMDYFRDGAVVLDRRGRIVGMNPSARELSVKTESSHFTDLFPCLKERDAETLLDPVIPQEVEAVLPTENGLRALRFRSQPHNDMTLVLISDVTGVKAEELRARQAARLQLVGRIANGVAHDFSNILCAVSGYAALLGRQGIPAPEAQTSFSALVRETQRGIAVANHLLDLCRVDAIGAPCTDIRKRIEEAVALLRVGLSSEWRVVADMKGDFDSTALSDAQLEQLVVSLGMLAADEQGVPGLLHVRAESSLPDGPSHKAQGKIAAVLLIAAFESDETQFDKVWTEGQFLSAEESGVVQSVVRSLIEEAGGRFDAIRRANGKHMYRIVLPRASVSAERWVEILRVPDEVRTRVADWPVVFAVPRREDALRPARLFEDLKMNVAIVTDIVALLQHVEADRGLKGIIVDRTILGEEGDALLRAIRKLRPRTGIVVMTDQMLVPASDLTSTIIFCAYEPAPETLLDHLTQAEELAMKTAASRTG